MDIKEVIRRMYFVDKLKVIDIADKLDVSKQRVSKILTSEFNEEYKKEKDERKKKNEDKRRKEKAEKKREQRGDKPGDVSIEEIRLQHEATSRSFSKRARMSDLSAVYRNLNAYVVVGNDLIYNDKVGAKPFDLPSKFHTKETREGRVSLSISIKT